jgi:hypothetical protein
VLGYASSGADLLVDTASPRHPTPTIRLVGADAVRTGSVCRSGDVGCTMEIMRATGLLAIVVLFVSHTATADVKRQKSIPESIWGSWAPSVEDCNKAEKSIITLAAKSYVSSEASCTIDWVSETPGTRGAIYSAHLQCSGAAEGPQKTVLDLVLWPKDVNEISVGADFSSLKTYLRCPASAPASTR